MKPENDRQKVVQGTCLKIQSGAVLAAKGGWQSLLFGLCLVAAAVLFVGCESSPPVPPPAVDPAALFYSTNVLHAGDVVEVSFQYSTNYSSTQRIALDGTLNMNSVGPVKAAGKTVVQLQQALAEAYKSLDKGDTITVNRVLTSLSVVYVSGAVLKPGEVELSRPLTVIEAVMAAGGFDGTRAKLTEVSVLRIENGQQHAYPINLKRVLQGKDRTPFYLQPFDIIYVPVKRFNY
jgi:polysaccharide export outer membrane protein